jgi:phytoene synthase
MNTATQKRGSITPWRLRERTRGLHRDLSRTIQSNFFYSFLFLPQEKREAIMDVYGVCRAIDDAVDAEQPFNGQTTYDPAVELKAWRTEIDACFEGRPTRTETRRLRRTLDRFPIPRQYFIELIDGCEMDLDAPRYETFEDLYKYCYRVAGVTGLMCIEIFTYHSPHARDYAVELGIALQLTNILRDLKEDAERGRVYLPQEDLRRFRYSEEELYEGVINDNFRDLMRFECERAREYYRRAAELLPEQDRPTMVAAMTMGKIYYRLLQRIESVDYDVFNRQIRLHRPERFFIALEQWARARAGSIGGLFG